MTTDPDFIAIATRSLKTAGASEAEIEAYFGASGENMPNAFIEFVASVFLAGYHAACINTLNATAKGPNHVGS